MSDFLIKHWVVILDTAAKVAAIFGVIGIWVAYHQYKHSVNLAKINERRAAVELAARECARYGNELIKQAVGLLQKIDKSGCQYLKHCKLNKDDKQLKLDATALTEEDRVTMKEYMLEAVGVVNSLETFSIPFVRGVADNETGFVECGRSFIEIFEACFPLYCLSNLQDYYKASQELYWRWRKQIADVELERQHSQAGKQFFVLTAQRLEREKANSRLALTLAGWFRKIAEQLSKPRN